MLNLIKLNEKKTNYQSDITEIKGVVLRDKIYMIENYFAVHIYLTGVQCVPNAKLDN